MVTLTAQGIYRDGKLELDTQIPFSEPTEVVVIFLSPQKEDTTPTQGLDQFSFHKAQHPVVRDTLIKAM